MPSRIQLTEGQQRVFDTCVSLARDPTLPRQVIRVLAVPGAGKTETIVQTAAELIGIGSPYFFFPSTQTLPLRWTPN